MTATLQKDEIRSAIERVAQFADERSRAIRVQFTTGEVQVFSSSRGNRRERRERAERISGPDLEIGFNAQYLLDFLRAIPQDQVAFELKDQKSAGELRPAGDEHGGPVPLRGHADEDLKQCEQQSSNKELWQTK